MANQLGIVVVDKRRKKTVAIEVAIPNDQHQEEGTREACEIPRAERRATKDVKGEGYYGNQKTRNTQGSDHVQLYS